MKKVKVKVKIYVNDDCVYCFTLEEFLRENNIEFESVNISKNKDGIEEIIKKSGEKQVPIIEIDKEIVVGFNKERICELLGINNH
jgi:glutaredoxin 3